MTRLAFFPALLVLLVASRAAASEGGGVMAFVWEAGNLLLLLGVLVYLGRKPVLNYLSERRQRIQDNLAGSERLLKEAEGRLAEWTEKAARLDHEIEELRQMARERAEQERAQILERKAETAYRKAYDEAVKTKVTNEWTQRILEGLNKYQPEEFPVQKAGKSALQTFTISGHGLDALEADSPEAEKPASEGNDG